MAFQYTTGTISQADSGSVGLVMVEKIRDDLVNHAAWDLVEEFTPGSGLVRWYVFKCLASLSGLPSDFYLVIGRTLGSGELRAFICESYTVGTHTAAFYGYPFYNQASVLYDASGRYTAGTFVLSTAVIPGTAPGPSYLGWTPSGVSTKWWLIVTDDGVTMAFNGASNAVMSFGAYTPLSVAANPMPLMGIGLGAGGINGNSSFGQVTRNPAAASITTRGAATAINAVGATGLLLGPECRLDTNDHLQGDQRPVSECAVVCPVNTGDSAIYGYLLGKQKRMRAGQTGTAPSGFSFGDAYTLQSRLWVPYLPTDHRIWDTGIPG